MPEFIAKHHDTFIENFLNSNNDNAKEKNIYAK